VAHRSDVRDLVEALFAERAEDPVAGEVARWLESSPRFRAFSERYRDKIRRKLRSARDAETLRDVRAELAVAERLLADRRFELAYEPYGSGRLGPDFGVTFRTTATLNLEVTRPRPRAGGLHVRRAIVGKLRQLPPTVPNVILVDADGVPAATFDVAGELRAVRQSVDRRDPFVLGTLALTSPRAFYERFLRPGGVVVRSEAPWAATLWVNRSARIALPEPAARAIVTALAGGTEDRR
jgi:hypothetical protein